MALRLPGGPNEPDSMRIESEEVYQASKAEEAVIRKEEHEKPVKHFSTETLYSAVDSGDIWERQMMGCAQILCNETYDLIKDMSRPVGHQTTRGKPKAAHQSIMTWAALVARAAEKGTSQT